MKNGRFIPLLSFDHAGDGNLYVYLCRDRLPEEEWEARKDKAFELMYVKSRKIGGMVSREHGIGLDKKGYLAATLGDTQIALMRGIKQVFDPNCILNPGKVI